MSITGAFWQLWISFRVLNAADRCGSSRLDAGVQKEDVMPDSNDKPYQEKKQPR